MQSDEGESGLTRVPSGVAGLDTILGGGFFRGGVYILQGPPGTGKTILGNQICFNNARRGNKAVYMTLLAESHARMLLNIQRMRFFDPSMIPGSLYYVSGFRALEQEGLKGLLALLRREVKVHHASVLMLDGLVAAEESAATAGEFKKFIHELQLQGDMAGCTTFLLTSGEGRPVRPEHTMVDGVVDLSELQAPPRSERQLRVAKFRGSAILRGQHSFTITEDGLEVYPRTEALYARPSRVDLCKTQRHSTGVVELDRMMGGGLPCNTSTLVQGPSGVGKTTLGVHFLSRSSAEEPGLALSFYETPDRLLLKADMLGLDLRKRVEAGQVELLWQPATETIWDGLAKRVLDAVQARGVRRLFIDGMDGFREGTVYPHRSANFFSALTNELRVREVTTLYTSESHSIAGPRVEPPFAGMSAVVENLILLRFEELHAQIYRLLGVLKVRDSDFDPTLREFRITNRGIEVAASFESAQQILTGALEPPGRKGLVRRLGRGRTRK